MIDFIQKLRSKDRSEREHAASMLKEQLDCGAPSTATRIAIVKGLMEMIEDESDDSCRAAGLMALCSSPQDAPVDRIVEMLADFDRCSLIEALCLIGETRDRRYLVVVEPFLKEEHSDIRIAAEEAYAVLLNG